MLEVKIKSKIIRIAEDYDPIQDPEPYMKDEHLAYFKLMLEKQLTAMKEVDSSSFKSVDPSFYIADEIDSASVQDALYDEARIKERSSFLARKIRLSIKRIEDGNYGLCLESQENIGLRRLKARPTTDYCVEVQERKDKEKNQIETSIYNQEEDSDI